MKKTYRTLSARVDETTTREIDAVAVGFGWSRSVAINHLLRVGLANRQQLDTRAPPEPAGEELETVRTVTLADDQHRAVRGVAARWGRTPAETMRVLLRWAVEHQDDIGGEPETSVPTKVAYLRIPEGWLDRVDSLSNRLEVSRSAVLRYFLEVGAELPDQPASLPGGTMVDCAAVIPVDLLSRLIRVQGGRSQAETFRRHLAGGLAREDETARRIRDAQTRTDTGPQRRFTLRLHRVDIAGIDTVATRWGVAPAVALRRLLGFGIARRGDIQPVD